MVIADDMDDILSPQGRYPESFTLTYLLEECQEWGIKKGGTWRILRITNPRLGGHGHSWCHGWSYFTPRKIPWKFLVDIFITSASGMGVQEGGYLENIEGYWLEAWWTWLFFMLWIILLYPKEDTLKVWCWYLYYKCIRNLGSRRGVLGGCWGFLTGELQDMVISDVMDDLILPWGRYS